MPATASHVYEYRRTLTSLGTFDGQETFDLESDFANNQSVLARVIKAQLTKQLPNVYNYGTFNNTRIDVTKDGGANWDTVILPTGIYTVEQITSAINLALGSAGPGWWISDTDPGFHIKYNLSTTLVYTEIDSTKLAVPNQLGIRYDVSDMYSTLGYTLASQPLLTDGVHSATEYPQLDTQGTLVDVTTNLQLTSRRIGGKNTNVMCSISLSSGSEYEDELFYPHGNSPTPYLQIINPGRMTGLSMQLTNGRGRPLVAMYGNFFMEIEILEIL